MAPRMATAAPASCNVETDLKGNNNPITAELEFAKDGACGGESRLCHQTKHTAVVLFYKYFLSKDDRGDDDVTKNPLLIHQYADYYTHCIQQFCKELCTRLNLKGRILIASEGINGTVSADTSTTLDTFINAMTSLDIVTAFPFPEDCYIDDCDKNRKLPTTERLFEGIDWKSSTTTSSSSILEPFPDLKVSIVKEIISTGGSVTLHDVQSCGGKHLSPQEFHECIEKNADVVLIDVRNTFEHAIGHFIHPSTSQPAVNPETVTFSSFDATYCASHAHELRNKKVLMYCTGGIRCEKASVMLKQRGVADVSQLSGGIHRYLEVYGDEGYFKGKNFVFDQRVSQRPSECRAVLPMTSRSCIDSHETDAVVGTCTECKAPFDELCGSRVCTVCRDLVLVCPTCQTGLREYHCLRHQILKTCYFTFLEIFHHDELHQQRLELEQIRDTLYVPATKHKNVRKTLSRQMEKISLRIDALNSGAVVVMDRNTVPRRCRTCLQSRDICDGRCWGFWKTNARFAAPRIDAILPIAVGDSVRPGPDWNEVRLGPRVSTHDEILQGTVLEVKRWGSGGSELDCVVVRWEKNDEPTQLLSTPGIYRWGVLALNGKRMYDVQKC